MTPQNPSPRLDFWPNPSFEEAFALRERYAERGPGSLRLRLAFLAQSTWGDLGLV